MCGLLGSRGIFTLIISLTPPIGLCKWLEVLMICCEIRGGYKNLGGGGGEREGDGGGRAIAQTSAGRRSFTLKRLLH